MGTITHTFVSPVVDAGDPNKVGPDEWNATHTITGTFPPDVTAQSYNRIVNGGIQISQENGVSALTTSLAYTVDQFFVQWVSSGTFTHQYVQVATPNGSRSRIRLTVNTADAALAAGDLLGFSTRLEGARVQDFLYGTASARQSILRFGFKAPAGTYSVAFRNSGTTRSYVANFTISAGQANTDTEQTFVIPGDTTGTWLVDTGVGIDIHFTLAAGTTYQGALGWSAGNFVGSSSTSNGMAIASAIFELFDVGLYLDPQNSGVAPRWTMPDYGQELLACQRYWRTMYVSLAAYGAASGDVQDTQPLSPWMRTTPAAAIQTAGTTTNVAAANTFPGPDRFMLQIQPTAVGNMGVFNRVYALNARM